MIFVLVFILFFQISFLPAKTLWNLGYDFTLGSDDYTSHNLYGGASHRLKKNITLSEYIGLFHDVDYDIIGSTTFKGKKGIEKNMHIGSILVLANGNLADENYSSSSVSFGILWDKDLSQEINIGLDYKYTTGSIYSGINRDVSGKSKRSSERQQNGSSITEESSSSFSSNTIIAKLDTNLSKVIKNLNSTLKLAFSKNSNDVKITSYGLEFLYLLKKKLFLSNNFTFTSNNLEEKDNYFSIGLNRVFN
ncbi:MAG: hypothetical protein HY919_06720 [Elusimicrobia bacterium]|nr:hypothetical protein [Elusimicrobiota bacterium]